jgi:hypothetical protein
VSASRRSDVAPWLIRPRPDIVSAADALVALAGGRYLVALQVVARAARAVDSPLVGSAGGLGLGGGERRDATEACVWVRGPRPVRTLPVIDVGGGPRLPLLCPPVLCAPVLCAE